MIRYVFLPLQYSSLAARAESSCFAVVGWSHSSHGRPNKHGRVRCLFPCCNVPTPYGVFAPNSEILVIKNRKPARKNSRSIYNELCRRCFYQCVIRFNFVTSDYIGVCRYHSIACLMSIVLAILGHFPVFPVQHLSASINLRENGN